MLNKNQKAAAYRMLLLRPPVIEGTRVIANAELRSAWLATVGEAIEYHKVANNKRSAFCDLAGVPD